MAFDAPATSSEAICQDAPSCATRSNTSSTIRAAFERPLSISSPECPPARPSTSISKPLRPSRPGQERAFFVTSTSHDPAAPTARTSLNDESRFTRKGASSHDGSSKRAPAMVSSSSTVNTRRSGRRRGRQARYWAIATPMPLSAPSVVSRARRNPSSR